MSIEVSRMVVSAWASLAVAADRAKKLDFSTEAAASLLLDLETATALAVAYDKVWDSIYWNDASRATKNRVLQTLNQLAFRVYTHAEAAAQSFDRYCDAMEGSGTRPESEVLELRRSLWLAIEGLKQHHKKQIEKVQLTLEDIIDV